MKMGSLSRWSGGFCLFMNHKKPPRVRLSLMKLCVSRVTEDPRGLVEPTDPKERRWDWDRPIKCDSVGGGGGGEEISLNEDIVIFTLGGGGCFPAGV